jgi:ParB-like chromosome segregation protein Spo0J
MSMRLTADQVKPELVKIETLRPHPANPRNGDLELLEGSVRRHGVFRTIVVSQDDVILAGNHTYMAAMGQGEEQLWISRVPFDHTDRQATEIMLVDNHAADSAQNDDAQLATVLATLDGDLAGTGFDDKDLKRLVDELAKNDAAQIEDPLAEKWGVIVETDSEAAQGKLMETLAGEGFRVRALF